MESLTPDGQALVGQLYTYSQTHGVGSELEDSINIYMKEENISYEQAYISNIVDIIKSVNDIPIETQVVLSADDIWKHISSDNALYQSFGNLLTVHPWTLDYRCTVAQNNFSPEIYNILCAHLDAIAKDTSLPLYVRKEIINRISGKFHRPLTVITSPSELWKKVYSI